jgi:hypothetical protein
VDIPSANLKSHRRCCHATTLATAITNTRRPAEAGSEEQCETVHDFVACTSGSTVGRSPPPPPNQDAERTAEVDAERRNIGDKPRKAGLRVVRSKV